VVRSCATSCPGVDFNFPTLEIKRNRAYYFTSPTCPAGKRTSIDSLHLSSVDGAQLFHASTSSTNGAPFTVFATPKKQPSALGVTCLNKSITPKSQSVGPGQQFRITVQCMNNSRDCTIQMGAKFSCF
jgi:hypothetical protein